MGQNGWMLARKSAKPRSGAGQVPTPNLENSADSMRLRTEAIEKVH